MIQKNIARQIYVNEKLIYIEYYNNHPNRPTIVFLHDSLGCVELWRNFPKDIGEATQCNVLVYDRLGYGKSEPMTTHVRSVNYLELEADNLNDLLTVLKIDSVILFGHSDGGSIALIAASKYPKKIKALICEAAHIFVEDVTLKGIYDAIESFKTTNLSERLQKYHGDKTETIFRAWIEIWTSSKFRNWNIENFLKNITCPLLFIQGDTDEYGTLNQVEKTISQINGKAEKYIIPNIGHTPHKEASNLVLNNVVFFLKRNI